MAGFKATATEASKTEEGVAVKVSFGPDMASNFELNCVQGIELIMQIGKVLDLHRGDMPPALEQGGS